MKSLHTVFLMAGGVVCAAAAGSNPSTLTLQSSANPSTLGAAVALTATVSPASATGMVTFYDGVAVLGAAAVSGGKAALSTASLAAGAHSLKAYYRGDAVYAASTATLSQPVFALGAKGFQTAANYSGVFNPRFVAVGDFNGDGKSDLVIANFSRNSVSTMRGNGDGTFQAPVEIVVDPASVSAPIGIVVGDFNGDGFADIAVANGGGGENNVAVLLGKGEGSFQTAVRYPVLSNPHSVAMADFNGDGFADLVVDNFGNDTVSVLIGRGDGSFQAAVTYPSGTGPIAVATGDFNADGRPDIAVTYANGVSVLLGKGDGTFQPPVNYTTGKTPFHDIVAVGDFNFDGKQDLAVTNTNDGTVSVLLGKGDGTFQAPVDYATGLSPDGVAIGDFNGDGLPDLVVTNSGGTTVGVLLGNGDGTFQPAVNYTVGSRPIPVAVGDFNGDGRTDLVVGNYLAGNVSVLLGVPATEPEISVAVNAASFAAAGLSPGLIFTLAGTGLGPATGVTLQLDANGRIANSLSGVTVLVDGAPAPLLFVRQDQINAVAPYSIASKVGLPVEVQVLYNGIAGNILHVPVTAVAPAIFSLGNGQGAIRNQDQSINGANNPAARGSFISIYATGEGQTNPAGVDGQLVTDANTHPVAAVSLTIDGIDVVPQFQGSTAFAGFFQVNAMVPQTAAPGVVAVVLKVAGQPSQTGITMVVQ